MTQSFAWLHLKADLPPAWELTTYGKDPAFGSLEFSTLRGKLAAFHWRRAGIRRKQRADADWTRHEEEDGGRVFSLRWEAEGLDLSWEFAPEAVESAEAVVKSTRRNDGEWRGYTLHGIRARVPAAFSLDRVQVHPGNVMMSFTDSSHRRLVYRRWGLPEHVTRGLSHEEFFRKLLEAEGLRVDELIRKTPGKGSLAGVRVNAGVFAAFSSRGLTPLARLLFRRARGRGWMWSEPEALRLCTLEQLAPKRGRLPELEDCFGLV